MQTNSVSFLATIILSLAVIPPAAAESGGLAGSNQRDPAPPFPTVEPMPAELPAVAEASRAAVFSMNMVLPGGEGAMNKGFFIDANGLALCALRYLCREPLPRFDTSDGTVLNKPRVLAVFPERQLALVRFNHAPRSWLKIADQRPPVGHWLALVSTLRDRPSLTGPLLSYRCRWGRPAGQLMSFASGRGPRSLSVCAAGAPLIDKEGRAVGVCAVMDPLSAQTLRFGMPIDGLAAPIAAALKDPGNLPLPLEAKQHPFDAVELDPIMNQVEQARGEGNSELALERARELIRRYPDSRRAKVIEWDIVKQQQPAGMSDEDFMDMTRRTAPPPNAPAEEKSAYQYGLASALCMIPNREDEAMKAFRQAFELDPERADVAGANLAFIHLHHERLDEAEVLYRKVTQIAPDRIDYFEALRQTLERKGDWAAADKLSDWIFALERFYGD